MPPTLRSEIRGPWNSVLAQQVKEPATTPDQLSSVFRTLWVEGKNRSPQVGIWHQHLYCVTCTHTQSRRNKRSFLKLTHDIFYTTLSVQPIIGEQKVLVKWVHLFSSKTLSQTDLCHQMPDMIISKVFSPELCASHQHWGSLPSLPFPTSAFACPYELSPGLTGQTVLSVLS